MDITSLVGAAAGSAFVLKLLTEASKHVGNYLEPVYRKRMAEAENEIRQKEAETNAQIALQMTEADIEKQELAIRCSERLVKAELRRQKNIERIISKAACEAPTSVSSKPVDEDWLANFFESCKDIGDDDMQALWAKLLAGEVAQPGRFLARTIQTVKMMSKSDADLFTQMAQYVWTVKCDSGKKDFMLLYYLFNAGRPETMPRLTRDEVVHLDTVGLIGANLTQEFIYGFNEPYLQLEYFGRRFVFDTTKRVGANPLPGVTGKKYRISCGNAVLTLVGKELFSVIPAIPNPQGPPTAKMDLEGRSPGELEEIQI